jgi:uncharacterized membrane protein YphA (DoxX/SURF4 family)
VSLPAWLASRKLAALAGIALGIVFLVAAWPKLVDPPGFAHEISNYRILPREAVNAAALVLPWVEALAGLALVTGFLRKSGAVIVLALLAFFMVGLSINLARKHPVDCGCFSTKDSGKTPEERLADMKLAILRDAGLAVLGVWSLRAGSGLGLGSDG